jgi:hypothetical protein
MVPKLKIAKQSFINVPNLRCQIPPTESTGDIARTNPAAIVSFVPMFPTRSHSLSEKRKDIYHIKRKFNIRKQWLVNIFTQIKFTPTRIRVTWSTAIVTAPSNSRRIIIDQMFAMMELASVAFYFTSTPMQYPVRGRMGEWQRMLGRQPATEKSVVREEFFHA